MVGSNMRNHLDFVCRALFTASKGYHLETNKKSALDLYDQAGNYIAFGTSTRVADAGASLSADDDLLKWRCSHLFLSSLFLYSDIK